MASLRILIAGGGTGGHIIPALAVARELVARHGAEVLFVGTERGLETRLVPAAGFPLRLIRVGPLNRVSRITQLKTILGLPASIFESRRLLRDFRPAAVLGVGGYASGPVMAAALSMKIPAMVFEPNAIPGMVNRMVGRRAEAAAVNFPAAAKWFRNSEVSGIPVRPEFFAIGAPQGTAPKLLVFGGSQGARILNTHLPRVMGDLLEAVPGLTVLHQCGLRNLETTEKAYAQSGADAARWQVKAFIDDMPARFAESHLIVSRSGASTVAELAAAGRPALLVPFAAAADAHQLRNAEVMVEAGAAAMLEEQQLDVPGKLLETLIRLLKNSESLAKMGAAARALAHQGAAERIADRLAEMGRSRD